MGRKTLIPEEKWEGLRHAMEEAAGARKTSGSSGVAKAGGSTGKKEKKKEKKNGKKKGKKKKGKKKGKKK